MTTGHARTHGPRKMTRPPSPAPGSSVPRGTQSWYGDASGAFLIETLDEWNAHLAFQIFPRFTSSSRIDRRDTGPFVLQTGPMSGSSRARCRSTSPNSPASCASPAPPSTIGSAAASPTRTTGRRIRPLLRLVVGSRVSASDPLFPRFVKFALDPGDRIVLDPPSEMAGPPRRRFRGGVVATLYTGTGEGGGGWIHFGIRYIFGTSIGVTFRAHRQPKPPRRLSIVSASHRREGRSGQAIHIDADSSAP